MTGYDPLRGRSHGDGQTNLVPDGTGGFTLGQQPDRGQLTLRATDARGNFVQVATWPAIVTPPPPGPPPVPPPTITLVPPTVVGDGLRSNPGAGWPLLLAPNGGYYETGAVVTAVLDPATGHYVGIGSGVGYTRKGTDGIIAGNPLVAQESFGIVPSVISSAQFLGQGNKAVWLGASVIAPIGFGVSRLDPEYGVAQVIVPYKGHEPSTNYTPVPGLLTPTYDEVVVATGAARQSSGGTYYSIGCQTAFTFQVVGGPPPFNGGWYQGLINLNYGRNATVRADLSESPLRVIANSSLPSYAVLGTPGFPPIGAVRRWTGGWFIAPPNAWILYAGGLAIGAVSYAPPPPGPPVIPPGVPPPPWQINELTTDPIWDINTLVGGVPPTVPQVPPGPTSPAPDSIVLPPPGGPPAPPPPPPGPYHSLASSRTPGEFWSRIGQPLVRSPDGNWWVVEVDNTGAISTVASPAVFPP